MGGTDAPAFGDRTASSEITARDRRLASIEDRFGVRSGVLSPSAERRRLYGLLIESRAVSLPIRFGIGTDWGLMRIFHHQSLWVGALLSPLNDQWSLVACPSDAAHRAVEAALSGSQPNAWWMSSIYFW